MNTGPSLSAMRRQSALRVGPSALITALVVLSTAACNGGGGSVTSPIGDESAAREILLQPSDLEGFELLESEQDVDDVITPLCLDLDEAPSAIFEVARTFQYRPPPPTAESETVYEAITAFEDGGAGEYLNALRASVQDCTGGGDHPIPPFRYRELPVEALGDEAFAFEVQTPIQFGERQVTVVRIDDLLVSVAVGASTGRSVPDMVDEYVTAAVSRVEDGDR